MHNIILHFYKDVPLRFPKPMVNFSLIYIQLCDCSEDTDTV